MWSTAAMCNMPDGCRWPNSCAMCEQGHGRSGNNRDYVLSTVKSIEAQGFRDAAIASARVMLHGDATLHR